MIDRRRFLGALGAGGALALGACAGGAGRSGEGGEGGEGWGDEGSGGGKAGGHVVVVGGGYGGATVARYLRLWSGGRIAVTLVERRREFVSCPISNLVLAGEMALADLTLSYDGLRRRGVRVIHDTATAVDAGRRRVRLARGGEIAYDRCVLAPSVDFMWETLPGMLRPGAQAQIPHAWKAGPQTAALRRQLEAMADGGVYAIAVPKVPYVCPPGPYERACLVAHYLKARKPRAKVLILDANAEVQSKKALFMQAWDELYKGMIDYRPDCELRDVDAAGRGAVLDFETVRADVLNVVPPQRAGAIAMDAGLRLINRRWVEVDWLTLEAAGAPGIHVLGDAVFPAPQMPKSGHMANQQGKVVAAAIVELLAGRPPNPQPLLMNTCYSFVDARSAVHVSSVHRYAAARQTFLAVPGAGGLSAARSALEGVYALGWARNIWADAFG